MGMIIGIVSSVVSSPALNHVVFLFTSSLFVPPNFLRSASNCASVGKEIGMGVMMLGGNVRTVGNSIWSMECSPLSARMLVWSGLMLRPVRPKPVAIP